MAIPQTVLDKINAILPGANYPAIVMKPLLIEIAEAAFNAGVSTPVPEPDYKEYIALLNQSGEDPPVATIIRNTLGFEPSYTRGSVGKYQINHVGGFPTEKTVVIVNCISTDVIVGHNTALISNDFVAITSLTTGGGDTADDVLVNSLLFIRVYDLIEE